MQEDGGDDTRAGAYLIMITKKIIGVFFLLSMLLLQSI